MILADSATVPWAYQLGVAVPFVMALGVVGKWLLDRLKESDKEKKELYAKVIDEVIPALKSSTDVNQRMLDLSEKTDADRLTVAKKEAEVDAARIQLAADQVNVIKKMEELRRRELGLYRNHKERDDT
jgi:hypothetical protein